MEINKSGPMTPDEIETLTTEVRPPVVFEAFNTLIGRNWNGRSATIFQRDVVDLILRLAPELTQQAVFDDHMLDVETAYRHAGWQVRYDKPGWNETYAASFVFTRKS